MIYPENFPSHHPDHAERKVFDALKQLDPYHFDVFWNRTFAGNTKEETDLYEIDFLVFDLREETLNHIFVIEVKGGNLQFEAKENTWYQSGREMDTGPDHQVIAYASNILKRYRKIIEYKVPVTWLLWFPDGVLDKNTLPTQFLDWRVLDQNNLDDALTAIDEAKLEQESSHHHYQGISPDEYEGTIKKDLTQSLGISTNLRTLLEEMKISIELAETHQKVFFTGLFNILRLAVEGCAGSGKTILAKCAAELLHEKGDKVLFLCYNLYLKARVEKELSDEIQTNDALGFMKYFISSREPEWYSQQNLSENEMFAKFPGKFKEVLQKYPVKETEKCDALLVDEAQDMDIAWLNMFLKFIKPGGKYILFYDRKQNIFRSKFDLPISEQWTKIPLTYNYRNTKKINAFINETLNTNFTSGEVPEGEKVRRREYRPEDLGGALFRSLSELHKMGHIPLENIKIITDGAAAGWELEKFSNPTFSYELLAEDKVLDRNKVYYSSIHKFKGCESEVVILILRKPLVENEDPNVLYTQLSRAKSLLYVLEPQS